MESVGGEVGRLAGDLAATHQPPPADHLVATLAGDLRPAPAPFILVLDDCHVLSAAPIFTTLQELVDQMPPAFHLAPHGPDLLTERELDVLRLVAEGLSNADIASRLFVTPGTAKWHVQNLFGKLGVSSRTQAVARAREMRLP